MSEAFVNRDSYSSKCSFITTKLQFRFFYIIFCELLDSAKITTKHHSTAFFSSYYYAITLLCYVSHQKNQLTIVLTKDIKKIFNFVR